jgi:hypothetical protein
MSDDLFDCEEEAKRPRIFWFLVFGVLWFSWIIPEANAAYDKAVAELQASNAIMRWWNSNEPGKARFWVIFWGFAGLSIVFVVAHFVALLHASVIKNMAEKFQDFKSQRDQKHFEAKMLHLENENQKQTKLSKSAQSKKELVMRLGNIDQFIRVLEHETDSSKRTVALQAAQAEMTTLNAKLASEEITAEAVLAPEVQEHAKETSSDLSRLGFAEDRLNRDLRRMFKLSDAPLALPEARV